VKSLQFSGMHENVKFEFIGLSGVTAQMLDMKRMYIKTIIKKSAVNSNKMLGDAWHAPNVKSYSR
jgi:hypothetical protein